MAATKFVIITWCLLSAWIGISATDGSFELCEQKGKIVCPCGLTTVKIAVDLCRQEDGNDCRPCNPIDVDEVCARYKNCMTCYTDDATCDNCYQGRSGRYCENVDEKASRVLTIYNYSDGVPLDRKRRTVEKCYLQKKFNAADVICFETLDELSCELLCTWGHKLDIGITAKYFCDKYTGTWLPELPRDCKPYVNCDINFAGVNKAKRYCTMNHVDGPVKCNVTCNYRESYHVCTLDGKWFPSLPVCLEKNPDFVTVGYYCNDC